MRDPEPHKHPRQASQRAADMAARTYIRAHLGWLRGLPRETSRSAELHWETLPRIGSADMPEQFIVDRERLRAIEYGRNAARRQFPRALENVVGDVDAWSKRIDAQLDILKRCVHKQAAFPELIELLDAAGWRRSTRQKVSAAAEHQPRLKHIFAGLVWLHWHDERALLAALSAVPASIFTTLLDRDAASMHEVQRLIELASDKTRPYLFQILADPRIWDVPIPTSQLVNASQHCAAQKGHIAAKFVTGVGCWPPPKLGPRLVAYALSLRDVDAKNRNRQLCVFEQMLPDQRLESWATWWREASRIERHARRFDRHFEKQSESGLTLYDRDEYRALDVDARALTMPFFDWSRLHAALPRLGGATPQFVELFLRCLELLNATMVSQTTVDYFIDQWTSVASAKCPPMVTQLLAAEAELLAAMVDTKSAHCAWVTQSVSSHLIDLWHWDRRALPQILSPLVRALSLLISHPPSSLHPATPFLEQGASWSVLMSLLKDGEGPEAAVAALAAVPPDSGEQARWLALWRLAKGDVDLFARWARGQPLGDWGSELAAELGLLAKDAQVSAVLANAIAFEQLKQLRRLTSLSRLVRVLRLPQTPLAMRKGSLPRSFAAYPAPLQPQLRELVAWDPRADAAAEEILGKDFPSKTKTHEELAALRNLIADAVAGAKRTSLEKRLAKLHQSLETPVSISDHRLENLRAKLARRVAFAGLERLEETLIETLQNGLKALGERPTVEWLERPDVIRILCGLPNLKPFYRTLALRLLGRTLTVPPSDLSDEPVNRDFLARMGARGLNVTPWLDGIGAAEIIEDDRRLTLRLERDPVAVLAMGAPFDTCLAPENFNFYSAVVNAADINKAVIFARDTAGTLQGRCLLALSDEGHMLAFHVYAHKWTDTLAAAFHSYTTTLADRVGATLMPMGTIRSLHGDEWYDDGPNDVTGQFAFLESDSTFFRDLASAAPSEVVSRFQTALAGRQITPLVIARLNDVALFSERPELIVPLLRHIGDPSQLDSYTMGHLIRLVRRAGDTGLALSMLDRSVANSLRDGWQWHDKDIARHLIELGQPQKALLMLRRTRETRVRGWQDEPDDRELLAAQALRALGRRHQALEIVRLSKNTKDANIVRLISDLEREIADTP